MHGDVVVSVICTAYNHEKYIQAALEGFVMQKTTFPYEVLVHDDASTDKTTNIIREYEKKYPEIIKAIYESENLYCKHDGEISRILKAHARGKYVAFCEGDDYWTDPLKLQKQFNFMQNHPEYTLCACSCKWLNMINGKIWNRCTVNNDKDITLEDVLLPKIGGRPFVYASVFVKADVWKNVPKTWSFPIGDLPLVIYACMEGKVRMLADNMCVYRWYSEGSWTARKIDDADRARVIVNNITALENLNLETHFKYDYLIKQAILKYKYQKALMTHDFKAIQETELLEIYKRQSLLHRLSDRLRCTMPKIHQKLLVFIGRRV